MIEGRVCHCGGTFVPAIILSVIDEDEDNMYLLGVDGFHCDICGEPVIDEATGEQIAQTMRDPAHRGAVRVPRGVHVPWTAAAPKVLSAAS